MSDRTLPSPSDLDRRIERIALLGEPARRALYRFVAHQPEPVSREQAAAALDVPHHVAKFHLDRLVDDGLLHADYRRPPGRGGPGAGRPAKVYRVVGDLDVSVPERRYDLAGRLLVRAVGAAARTGAPLADTLADVAHDAGCDLAVASAGRRTTAPARRVCDVLASCGFEPVRTRRDITLHNCPFDQLAEEDRELVCGMNLSFVRGVLDGAGVAPTDASTALDPLPGGCCVRITTPPR